MKRTVIPCLMLAAVLPAVSVSAQKTKKAKVKMEQVADSIPGKNSEGGERNVMLNASDANKPREIQEEFYKLKYCSTVVYMVPRA